MSDENYWCMHVSLDLLHLHKKLCMDWAFIHIMLYAMLEPIIQVHVVNFRQASGRGDNDESFGNKKIILNHQSLSFRQG